MPTMAIGTGFEGIWVPVSGLSGPAVDSGGIIGDDLFDQDEDVVDQVAHCVFGLVGLAGGDRVVNGGVVVDAGRAAGDAIGEAGRGAQGGVYHVAELGRERIAREVGNPAVDRGKDEAEGR